MRFFVCATGLLFALLPPQASGQDSIRCIDFKNFSFAWDENLSASAAVPSLYQWISPLPHSHIRTENGLHRFYEYLADPQDALEREHAPVLSVDSAVYGDLDGGGTEQAAVHLNYGTGGTQNWDFLYIFKRTSNRTQLIAVLESGSRAYGGLVRSSIEKGLLVLDFADAERRTGDCCSEGFIRVRYRDRNGAFVEEGPRTRGDLQPLTR